MLKYAAEDVLYLGRLFAKFKNMMNMNQISKAFTESKNSVDYSSINLDIAKYERLSLTSRIPEKKEIRGMLK